MRMYDIIQKKRDGEVLSDEEIRFFVNGYTDGSIPDYQASAFCMAVYFRGMTDEEILSLTDAMAHSGDTLDLSRFGTLSADKHSTGGVGDKTSLIVAPLAASLGAVMTKMSGRGLGHTGGTIDKLESIPGYNTALTTEEFLSQVEKTGIAVIGQTGNLTPADKKLYALRDVTATVDSIPLITSSIMSKKLAAGSHNIVLDVKVGSGAFMKTAEDAEKLAEKMVAIGKLAGRNIAAVLTNMDIPLGNNIGNALEVQEALAILKGEKTGDLYEVCLALVSNILSLTFSITPEEARERAEKAIRDGSAFRKMKEWIGAQGGDVRYLDDPGLFPLPAYIHEVRAADSGYISRMDAEEIGLTGVMLGAGRETKEADIDYSAGIVLRKKVGDFVREGDVLALLYTNRGEVLQASEARYRAALSLSPEAPEQKPLIYKVVR